MDRLSNYRPVYACIGIWYAYRHQASELANGLVVQKKDDRIKKTSHLILEKSMNEAFIWLSGLRFIDKQNYSWLEIVSKFSLKKNAYKGSGKNIIFPTWTG